MSTYFIARNVVDCRGELGSRAGFAQAAVAREGARVVAGAQATIAAHRDDPVEALTRAFAGSPPTPPRTRSSAECLVRLAISHAGLPLHTARRSAAAVATLLAPYLEQALVAGSERAAA